MNVKRVDAFAPYRAEGHSEVWRCEDGRSVTATWRDGKWDVVENDDRRTSKDAPSPETQLP